MLSYPARFEAVDAGFVVTFRDIPEAQSAGSSLEDAVAQATDALTTAMEFYFEDRREVPLPTLPKKGEVAIELPLSLSAKVMLLNEMLRSGITPAQLARKLGTTPQAVSRIVDLHHATKIDTLAEAFGALGRKLRVTLA